MKTIELTSGSRKTIFTTKSVTLDNREFLYSHMSDVTNDTENNCYTFNYEGEHMTLPYEAKDAKVLNVIFGQVIKMEEKRKAALQHTMSVNVPPEFREQKPATEEAEQKTAEKEPEQTAKENADQQTAEAPSSEEPAEKKEETEEVSANEQTEAETKEETPANEQTEAEAKEETPANEQTETDVKDETSENADGQAPEEKNEQKPAKQPMAPEKKARLKKSLIVFGIIIIAVIASSLIYYKIFGTAKDPSSNAPNSTESEQYVDIDEKINELTNGEE